MLLSSVVLVATCGDHVHEGVAVNADGWVRDTAPDRITLLPGEKGLVIQDGSSGRSMRYRTDRFVTDIGSIRVSDSQPARLVVFTYPNEEGGGTFRVMSMPERKVESEWHERRGVGAFETVTYRGRPALAYLQDDDLVIRDGTGQLLKRATIPQAHIFRRVWIAELGQDRLALLASGTGYTQYHMVVVLNERSEQLEYQEMRKGLAFGLKATATGFDVWTRGQRVGYLGSSPPCLA
jgi:hypothetical protein